MTNIRSKLFFITLGCPICRRKMVSHIVWVIKWCSVVKCKRNKFQSVISYLFFEIPEKDKTKEKYSGNALLYCDGIEFQYYRIIEKEKCRNNETVRMILKPKIIEYVNWRRFGINRRKRPWSRYSMKSACRTVCY